MYMCYEVYAHLREISNTVIAGESNIFPNCKWYDVVYCGCWFNIYVEEELS